MPRDTLRTLERDTVRCERCPRLREWCAAVAREKRRAFRDYDYWGKPVPGFGDPKARLVMVGLAPGAHGSNRTGRPFTGDASGDWLFQALHQFGFASQPAAIDRNDGLVLTDAWITAVGRCAPPQNKPTPAEIGNCRPFLERELKLLSKASLILAFGKIAFDGYLNAAADMGQPTPAPRPKFAHGGYYDLPGHRLPILATYHPSRQNTQTGRLTRPMWNGIFRQVRTLLR